MVREWQSAMAATLSAAISAMAIMVVVVATLGIARASWASDTHSFHNRSELYNYQLRSKAATSCGKVLEVPRSAESAPFGRSTVPLPVIRGPYRGDNFWIAARTQLRRTACLLLQRRGTKWTQVIHIAGDLPA